MGCNGISGIRLSAQCSLMVMFWMIPTWICFKLCFFRKFLELESSTELMLMEVGRPPHRLRVCEVGQIRFFGRDGLAAEDHKIPTLHGHREALN